MKNLSAYSLWYIHKVPNYSYSYSNCYKNGNLTVYRHSKKPRPAPFKTFKHLKNKCGFLSIGSYFYDVEFHL